MISSQNTQVVGGGCQIQNVKSSKRQVSKREFWKEKKENKYLLSDQ